MEGPEDTPKEGEAAGDQKTEGKSEAGERDEGFETDRDAFTPQTRTVSKGRFILESAYTFVDNPGIPATHSVPELLLRYGLASRLELRLGWNFETGGGGNDVSGSEGDVLLDQPRIKREYRLLYGLKANLTKQDQFIPESAVIVQGFTATGGANPGTQIAATTVAGWRLPWRWKLDTALRYGTNSESGNHFGTWAPSTVLRVPLGERWAVHAEYFGVFAQGHSPADFVREYISPGFHFLVTPNLEVGVRVGWGLNQQSARFFSNVGFGWRF
jgi:hypothetical protein